LAKLLFFQFADGPYPLEEGLHRLNNSDNLKLELSLKTPINHAVAEFHGFRRITSNVADKLAHIACTMYYRSTSVEADEPICLATLLGCDVATIIQDGDPTLDDRMTKFWSMLPEVPSSILFRRGPRLKAQGYRWAPRTLRRKPGYYTPSARDFKNEQIDHRTSEGLMTQHDGLRLRTGGHRIGESFHARDNLGTCYRIRVGPTDWPHAYDKTEHSFNPRSEHLGFISMLGMDVELAAFDGSSAALEGFTGILVSILRTVSDVIHARYLCNCSCVKLERIDNEFDTISRRLSGYGISCTDEENPKLASALAVRLSPEQKWCVD